MRLAAVLVALSLSGCGGLLYGYTENVNVRANVPATCFVDGENGRPTAVPTSSTRALPLVRGREHKIRFTAAGFEEKTVTVASRGSGSRAALVITGDVLYSIVGIPLILAPIQGIGDILAEPWCELDPLELNVELAPAPEPK